MLKLQFRDRRREPVWLVDQTFTIGKASSNSLMINDDSVEDFHLEIRNEKDLHSIINSSGSTALLLNGKPVARKAILKANDIITIGTIELEIIDPKYLIEKKKTAKTTNFPEGWSIYSKASWLEQNRFFIKNKIIIGRDKNCDITLPLDHLSRNHLALEIRNGKLFIEDLDSSNGTFVNGQRVKETQVHTGDKIKLDVVTFEVYGPSQALDPNKTIIRTKPSKPKVSQKPNPQSTNLAKQKLKPQPQKRVKKRLSSEGKQDWLSGENQIKKKKKYNFGRILIVIAILITAGFLWQY